MTLAHRALFVILRIFAADDFIHLRRFFIFKLLLFFLISAIIREPVNNYFSERSDYSNEITQKEVLEFVLPRRKDSPFIAAILLNFRRRVRKLMLQVSLRISVCL